VRLLTAGFGALAIVIAAGCAAVPDQGSLVIRCPSAGGAIAVANGAVTIDGIILRIGADLIAPASVDDGITAAIDVQGPAMGPSDRSPSIDCVRIARPERSEQWDTTPRRIQEFRDGTKTRVLATARDGPHWAAGDVVVVTVWLKTAGGGSWHVLTLDRQLIHP
jgi:hypothetical protein